MDHAIGSHNVSLGDGGLIDHDLAHIHFDREGQLSDRIGRGHLGDIRSQDFTSDDMVSQDLDQLILVLRLEQALDSAGRQFGEGGICGGKDGEGAISGQGLIQTGGGQSGNQGLEIAICHGNIHNRHWLGGGGGRNGCGGCSGCGGCHGGFLCHGWNGGGGGGDRRSAGAQNHDQ